MCGIFGLISSTKINYDKLKTLVAHAKQRGRDSSGLLLYGEGSYKVYRADYDIDRLLKKIKPYESHIVLGHSRLITNGLGDNQPVVRDNMAVIHNGIIVNEDDVWQKLSVQRKYQIDSEVIVAIAEEHLSDGGILSELSKKVLAICQGVIACALILPKFGKLLLFSNNGSLYVGESDGGFCFSSERFSLQKIACDNIKQVKEVVLLDIPISAESMLVQDEICRKENLIPSFKFDETEKNLLQFIQPKLKRCTRCILPETMPFIKFDKDGVCNYCHHYQPRNKPKPKEELFQLVEPYRRKEGNDCIVPFSGGRDSCYALHLIVNSLKMKPVTYTYDWGMITDLGRRNISRMCAALGVENIIIAANISKKRRNMFHEFKGMA